MTTREKVRAMLAQGMSNREIATLLGLSVQNIWKHVRKIKEEQR